jgi:peptidylglycine monooxygenase
MSDRELFVALGRTRYRVERPFYVHGGPGFISDVAVNPSGAVHVLIRRDSLVDPAGPAVVTLDANGRILSEWGGELIVDGHMFGAAPDGRLFIVDRDAHEVVICTGERRIGGLGKRHQPLRPFNHPTAVAFCPKGTTYVSDGYANHKVHRFSPSGEPLMSWGELGVGPGQFINPHSVWVLSDGRVVVADRENDRLQVFDESGTFLAIWTGFAKPLDLWGDAEGRLYVTDLVPSLTLLSPTGERLGRCRPVLNGAHGMSGDAAGNLYLAEPSPSRVTKLVRVD